MNIKNSNKISDKSIEINLIWNIYWITNKIFEKKVLEIYDWNIKNLSPLLQETEWIFILIIKDLENSSTHIINDKLWLHPFYYKLEWNKLIYDEDLTKISNNLEENYLNLDSLIEIVQLGYITKNKTILKWINKLEKWSILSFANGKIINTSYYEFKAEKWNNANTIYDTFVSWVKKRIIWEKIYSDLSWWFDTRLIMLTLIKVFKKQNIIFKTDKYYDLNDLEISKILAKKLKLNHLILDENTDLDKKLYSFCWLCWWEMLWNSLMPDWFVYENIEEFLIDKKTKIIKKEIKYSNEYWIQRFLENILRSEINTVQWKSRLYPANFFLWKDIFPFLDTDFLEKVIWLKEEEIVNYKTYKKIYNLYFKDFFDIKYTFNSEREWKNIIENEYLFFKNYKLEKKEYLKIVMFNKKNFTKNHLSKIFNYKIIYKKPLEIYWITKFILKINNIQWIR